LHEDEAALRMAKAFAGRNVELSEPHEGKINLKAAVDGIVKIDRTFVDRVNSIPFTVLATLKTNTPVQKQQKIAGTRVIPLIMEEESVLQIESLAVQWRQTEKSSDTSDPVWVKPFRPMKVGLITTGSEVFGGRIQDKFGPVVKRKVEQFGSEIIEQRLSPDDSDKIVQEIRYFLDRKADLILLTGGMSVDPDDRTPGAIQRAGARTVSYGTPMLPGSMLMMAYIGQTPVMGLPGCVMHDPYTSFDVLLPRICAGEEIVREDITTLGYGGLHGC